LKPLRVYNINVTPQHIKFKLFVKNKTGQLRAIFLANHLPVFIPRQAKSGPKNESNLKAELDLFYTPKSTHCKAKINRKIRVR